VAVCTSREAATSVQGFALSLPETQSQNLYHFRTTSMPHIKRKEYKAPFVAQHQQCYLAHNPISLPASKLQVCKVNIFNSTSMSQKRITKEQTQTCRQFTVLQ